MCARANTSALKASLAPSHKQLDQRFRTTETQHHVVLLHWHSDPCNEVQSIIDFIISWTCWFSFIRFFSSFFCYGVVAAIDDDEWHLLHWRARFSRDSKMMNKTIDVRNDMNMTTMHGMHINVCNTEERQYRREQINGKITFANGEKTTHTFYGLKFSENSVQDRQMS